MTATGYLVLGAIALVCVALFGIDADRSARTDADPWTSKDKVQHLVIAAGLAFVACLLGVALVPSAIITILLGAGWEFTPRRIAGKWLTRPYASYKDIVADVIGAVAGAFLGAFARGMFT